MQNVKERKTFLLRNTFYKTNKKRGNKKMLIEKKRDNKRNINLKQELFEDVIHTNKILYAVSIAEAVFIVVLCIALIVKGA